MSKLTLSIDSRIVAQAKRVATERGVSVSKMVEAYLAEVARPLGMAKDTPILRSLRGSLTKGTRKDYRKHLAAKYR